MIRFLKKAERMQVVKGGNKSISCVTDWLPLVTTGNIWQWQDFLEKQSGYKW